LGGDARCFTGLRFFGRYVSRSGAACFGWLQQTTAMLRACRVVFFTSAFLALAGPRTTAALDLTGILLRATDLAGNPAGPVWHPSSGDRDARPLGLSGWVPNELRTVPLNNRTNGEIGGPLFIGTYIMVGFWQCPPEEIPAAVILNFYFNGDNLTPGISALVAGGRGLTHAIANPQATTLSLYLRGVENNGGLFYD